MGTSGDLRDSGGSAWACSRCSPAVVSFAFTNRSPAQPTPASAPTATTRPAVRRSSAVPPSTAAATRAAAPLSADSASAIPSMLMVTAGPIPIAVGSDTTRVTSSSAAAPSTDIDPARAWPGWVSA